MAHCWPRLVYIMSTLFVHVVSGRGKWAYWHDQEKKQVVADTICNVHGHKFAGKLAHEVLTTPCDNAELFTTGFREEHPKSIWAKELEEYYDKFDDD